MLRSLLNLTRASKVSLNYQWARVYPFRSVPVYNFASFQDRLEKRQQKMSEQEFKKEIEFLVNKPSFTMADYKQRVIDGLHKMKKGLKAKLMSGNEATEASLMTQLKIMNAMYDHELVDATKIQGPVKKELSLTAQTTIEEVNVLIKNFEYLESLHGWLKELKDRGEPLPNTQEELTQRYRKDRPLKKSYLKFKIKRRTYSKRMIRRRLKWGPKKML